jgi:ribosomal protein S27AE
MKRYEKMSPKRVLFGRHRISTDKWESLHVSPVCWFQDVPSCLDPHMLLRLVFFLNDIYGSCGLHHSGQVILRKQGRRAERRRRRCHDPLISQKDSRKLAVDGALHTPCSHFSIVWCVLVHVLPKCCAFCVQNKLSCGSKGGSCTHGGEPGKLVKLRRSQKSGHPMCHPMSWQQGSAVCGSACFMANHQSRVKAGRLGGMLLVARVCINYMALAFVIFESFLNIIYI